MSRIQGGAMSAPASVFLGLGDPLQMAARVILDAAAPSDEEADLSAATVVVPGARARRQLLRALLALGDSRGLRLVPPSVLLPHEIELRLWAQALDPVADEASTRLAWAEALRACDESDRVLLAPAGFPGLAWRIRTADRLRSAAGELEAAGLSSRTLAEAAARLGAQPERYFALERVAGAARRLLAAEGMVDVDVARRRSLEQPPPEGGPVFLLGTVDLTARACRALSALGSRVQVLCLAEEAAADGFDALGVVRPDVWSQPAPEVPLDRVVVADRPIDQAEVAASCLAAFAEAGRVDADRCAVVVADDELVAGVARELAARGVPAHDARGRPVAALPPGRVLARLAGHLREPTTRTLRALLLEPSVERVIARRAGTDPAVEPPLAQLDAWLEYHQDRALDAAEPLGGAAHPVEAVRELTAAVTGVRRLGNFAAPLLELLGELFADAAPAEDRGATDGALACIRTGLEAFARAPAGLQPEVDAADAIEALLAWSSSARVREEPRSDELDLVGWLELPFDPAVDLVVVGMNDGRVPSTIADPLFPDALRRAVGLPDDRRRAARDAWVLTTALARRSVTFVVGRRSVAGDPLVPSRLLLTGRGEELAKRVLALTRAPERRPADRRATRAFGSPPAPAGPVRLDRMRVTAFARYLASPYHFWLEHLLGLGAPEPAGGELDPRGFGVVVHAVLERFGRRPEAVDLGDPDRIVRLLGEELEGVLLERAGPRPSAGLRIQRRVLEQRFGWFACRQAEEVRDGWRVHHVEIQLEEGLEIPGQEPVTLVGKVDRVDYNERQGRWRILDYKAGDRPRHPDGAHRSRSGAWRDLQLPLYRFLLAERLQSQAPGDIELGYFGVGATAASVGVVLASQLPPLVEEAVERARDVVRRIRSGELPFPEGPVPQDEALAILCRTTALIEEEEEET